jgi:hypothetical protein
MDNKRSIVSSFLILAGIGLLIAVYFLPIWWVSLTAPNYPEEAFPDGVRIHFHMNGVFNGCQKIDNVEITEVEALDCVHEMDTINHYVGMYPIAAGGVIERAFSPFLIALLSIMLLGFLCRKPKVRMIIMTAGFLTTAIWMYLSWYGADGLKYQSNGYIHALVTAMDQDTNKETSSDSLSSGQALIERLKKGLGEYYVPPESAKSGTAAPVKPSSEKSDNIDHLRATFEKDMERKSGDDKLVWDGSGRQMMSWHYQKNLGRYFNNPAEIAPMVATMSRVAEVFFWGIIAAMVLLLFGARKNSGLLYWLLILVPMALPLFFIIEYSAWLWWYGHNLNAMGAFSVKPFMPTVFGQGKVAQFTTHSYPSIGFGLMMLMSVILALAALIRRKQSQEQG